MVKATQYNTSENQKIKDTYIQHEVLAPVSVLIDHAQRQNVYWMNEWEIANLYETVDGDEQPKEIYEYWMVTDALAKRLEDEGEMVVYEFDRPIWGRQTTGQTIALDDVISVICNKMGLLC